MVFELIRPSRPHEGDESLALSTTIRPLVRVMQPCVRIALVLDKANAMPFAYVDSAISFETHNEFSVLDAQKSKSNDER